MLTNNESIKYETLSIKVLDTLPTSNTISIFKNNHNIFIGTENDNNYLLKLNQYHHQIIINN